METIAYTSSKEGQIQTPCPYKHPSHYTKSIARVGSLSCIHWCEHCGGRVENDYPITHIEDSQSIGFWELRCDPSVDFWDALEKAYKNNEM